MLPNQTNQVSRGLYEKHAIEYSGLSAFVSFFILFVLQLEFKAILFLSIFASLLVFLIQDSNEMAKREQAFYRGYYPPEYTFYKFFMIITTTISVFIVLVNFDVVTAVLAFFLICIIAALIAVFPYLQNVVKVQNKQLFIQKEVINDLSQKIYNQTQIVQNFLSGKDSVQTTEKANLEQLQEKEQQNAPPKPTYSSVKEEEWVNKQLERVEEMERLVEGPTRSTPLVRPDNIIRITELKSEERTRYASPMEPESRAERGSTGALPQTTNIVEKLKENFSGYLFFGAIIFLFIAGLAWILVFFPTTAEIEIGVQTWIAGDSVVIFGILVILISEFIIGKSKYSEHIPINYLGIGVGLGISIIGLLSIRFGLMPIFLTEFGFVDKNWLFFMLSILVASLSWIYAWRSPYRDLIFGSLITGFIIVDYSLQFSDLLTFVGLLTGLFYLLIPGFHASLTETKDNRFLFGGFIVYNLVLLKIENILALLQINELVYVVALIVPAITLIIIVSLNRISSFFLLLCMPLTMFPLIINDVTFINTYISESIYYSSFICLPLVLLIPKVIKRSNLNYDVILVTLNTAIIIIQSFLVSFQIVSGNSWFLILEPAILNSVLVINELFKGRARAKIDYIIAMQSLSIASLGLFFDQFGLMTALLLLSVVITLLLITKDYSMWIKYSYLVISLTIISLGSFFGIASFWELLIIPLVIPLILAFLWIKNSFTKDLILPTVTIPLLAIVAVTISQPIYATSLMVEYFIVTVIVGLFLILSKQKEEKDVIYWFMIYLGFIGTTIYPEYDLLIFYSLFIVLSIESFVILLLYMARFAIKRVKQNFYDIANVIIFGSLFLLGILEQYNAEYFLLTFVIFLILNILLVLYLLRFSGLDFTFAILMPALVLIGKEMYVTQYLAQQVDPFYSLIEFTCIAVYGFGMAILSRRVSEYEALISPNITAMFSIELVLIVLFVNKILTGYYAFYTFFGLITIITVVNFIQKGHLRHTEYLLIILSSIILSIVIPDIKIDQQYVLMLMGSIAIFWFILRFKIQKFNLGIDIISILALVVSEYIISLNLVNDIFIQSGLVAQQLLIVIVFGSLILKFKSFTKQQIFNMLLVVQVPFWLSIVIFFDLELQLQMLYSQFTDFVPVNDLAILKVTLFVLFALLLMIILANKFDEKEFNMNLIVSEVITTITMGLVLIQLIISQFLTDSLINGSILVLILFIVLFLSAFSIKRKNQLQTANLSIIVSSFYLLVTITMFLLGNGLTSGLLAIIGTILVVFGFSKDFKNEQIVIGVFFLIASITKIVFDIVNNFDVLIFEIAVSASILAVCLLLLGMIVNYRLQQTTVSD